MPSFFRLLVAIIAILIAASVGAAAPATRPNVILTGATFADAAADQAVLARIVEEGSRLLAAGKTAPTATLIEQLSRKQAIVALPADVPGAGPAPGGEEIRDRLAQLTLVLGGLYKCDKCSHTHCGAACGFVLTASGVAVTNYHVIDSKRNMALVAMTREGRIVPVREVLAADKSQDVALVQLDADNLRPIALARQEPRPGADIFVLSHPDSRLYTFTRGMVSRYFHTGGVRDNAVFMQITADYARGSSGGPVANARGEIVGMVASTNSVYYTTEENGQQKNLQMVFKDCVPVAAIRALFKGRGK